MTDIAAFSTKFASDGTVLRHPDRTPPRYSLPRAIKNIRLQMKDKEDTSLVFKIYESLTSKDFLPRVEALTLSDRAIHMICSTCSPAMAAMRWASSACCCLRMANRPRRAIC